MTTPLHPRHALFDAADHAPLLPVCDHYAGVEARMRKALALQAEMGPAFDVTLDGEDGAAAGGEAEHAALIAEMVNSPANAWGRVGARIVAPSHPAFDAMLEVLLPRAGAKLAYLMVPKPRHAAELAQAIARIDAAASAAGLPAPPPIHTLVETHGALAEVQAIAAMPRVQSVSFGLMDFVSAHRGAIPQSAMTASGQFEHPLVLRAKLEISAACHAHRKTPSHCVVTEFNDKKALQRAAERAAHELGYLRMWSIHPDQIRLIVDAFAPSTAEVDQASEILLAARDANWAPVRHRHHGRDHLHDRASFRYFWQVLERAHRTSFLDGPQLSAVVREAFFSETPGDIR